MLQIAQDQRDGMERLWLSHLLGGRFSGSLGMFLYVSVWVLCIKMKKVVKTGLELPSAYLQVSTLTTGGI